MSASTIIDSAPLGAPLRYTDGVPKPLGASSKSWLLGDDRTVWVVW